MAQCRTRHAEDQAKGLNTAICPADTSLGFDRAKSGISGVFQKAGSR
jgi:hypothetical protein